MPKIPRRVRRAPMFCLKGMSWAVVAALSLVSAFHVAHREPWNIVVGLVAVTPWLYMSAWVTLSIGLFARRRLLSLASIVLVALQLWWVLPDFDPMRHLVVLAPGDVAVRIFDANVSQNNFDLAGIAGEIRRDRAQVVAVEEITPQALASLRATGLLASYRYSLVSAVHSSYGMALWSKFPLRDGSFWNAGPHPEIRAWVELPDHRRLRLDVVHTDAPYGSDEPERWVREINAIRDELAAEPHPLVVVGDLNATWYDWHFQALLRLGLRDAAVVAGQGWRMTFPRNQGPVLPYVRIDHVLLSKGIALNSYRVGYGSGSAHHPIMVSIGLGAGSRKLSEKTGRY